MDDERSDEALQLSYLFGTVDELIERIQSIRDYGVQHLMFNPLVEDVKQVELFAKHIMPNI